MREIKFRFFFDKEDSTMEECIRIDLPNSTIPDPKDPNGVIAMQYTGLKDKNGKEIYEGDICKVSDDIYEIIYSVKDASFRGKFYKKPMEHYYLSPILNNFEVIGNIYENPELTEHR